MPRAFGSRITAEQELVKNVGSSTDGPGKKQNTESPYSVEVPGTLKSVAFIEKDTKRFPDSSGWGYAQFNYDAASGTFKPFGDASSFATKCYKCHTIVKATDYIFTAYPER
jgi:hypothetical protein